MLTVEDSVYQCNKLYGKDVKTMNNPCCKCGADRWRVRWGIDAQYASQYNPGEYCEFTCADCGYSWQSAS